MSLNASPTELTTAATDALLGVECLLIALFLGRTASSDRWRSTLWCWVFGLMAFSSLLGVIAHGLDLASATREALWWPLYLSLGILVALILVGAVHDWRGRTVAGRLVPWAIGTGAAFFALTQSLGGAFLIFVAYETVAVLCVIAIYVFLAVTRRLNGAAVIASAMLLNLAAAGIQASSLSATLIVPLDHNGLFHLVQMAAGATLGWGVYQGHRIGCDRSKAPGSPPLG